MKKTLTGLFLLTIFLLFYSSCKTTKNTFTHRQWHNMNARYNGYFLAGEDLKEVIKKIETEYRYDYHELIPVFIYPNKQSAPAYNGEFDKIIKRVTGVIERHAIVNEKSKVEIANACKWIDENYTIAGIADLYKLELLPALDIFKYVSEKYPDPEAKYRGLLWLMKTYNRLGSFTKTEVLLDEIKSAKDFPKDKSYTRELALIITDYRINRNDYPQAIESLKKAISLTKKKKTKARYTYLLAQLYAKTNDLDKAVEAYKKVVKLHPAYEMVFNAKMSIATTYPAGQGKGEQIKKELLKMSKDGKNLEYLDQVFYALAVVSHKENDIPSALEYLEKSIDNSINNPLQKGLAYIKQGDILLGVENYVKAENSYDSALTLLPSDYSGLEKIQDKKKSLTELVENLEEISLQDSLQRLEKMSEKERRKAISKMIKYKKEEEERLFAEAQRKEQLKQSLTNTQQNQPTLPGFGGAQAWYFYNSSTVQLGISDFKKKWGDRKLEDNWRRSQRQTSFSSDNYAADSTTSSSQGTTNSAQNIADREEQEIEDYLKTIPSGQKELDASNLKMTDAYYNAGVIYKEQLNNNNKSVEMFEEMLKRFPDNKYKLTVYYHLYRTYLGMGNTSKADYYKNILLNDHPDTEYAKLIRNPEYAKDLMASKNEIEKLYEETFNYYKSGNYKAALANCNKAESDYPGNYLMPQFDLLSALAIGRTQNTKALEDALTKVVVKHPLSPVRQKAQEYLDLLHSQNPTTADTTKSTTAKDNKTNLAYYWVAIIDTTKGSARIFEEKINLLSNTVYQNDNLKTELQPFADNYQLITVKTLNGESKAWEYYQFLEKNAQLYSGLQKGSYRIFLITSNDYTALQTDKNAKKYQTIFDAKNKTMPKITTAEKKPATDNIQKQQPVVKQQPTPPAINPPGIADAPASKPQEPVSDSTFFWVAIVDASKGNIKKFEDNIKALSNATYSKEQLTIEQQPFSGSYKVFVVKSLNGETKSWEYYQYLESKPEVTNAFPKGTSRIFLIKASDYDVLMKTKNAKKYQDAFEAKNKSRIPTSPVPATNSPAPKPQQSLSDSIFFWVAVVDGTKGDLKKFEDDIRTVSGATYGNDQLEIQQSDFSGAYKIIIVKSLNGKTKALEYFHFLNTKQEVKSAFPESSTRMFLISDKNYNALIKTRNAKKYFDIFNAEIK